MRIALTGATGFLGRYLVRGLSEQGHSLRAWHRAESDRTGLETSDLEWIPGALDDAGAAANLVASCEAVVHAALDRPGPGFRGAEGDLVTFLERNVLGTVRLIEAARAAGVRRFVFISTCAVHEKILDDRPLDETHPAWPLSHYGAHKAALEMFVHSYGLGQGYEICALRPCGIYGLAHPTEDSKWYSLVRSVVRGEDVECIRGGKEVHAADVAAAVGLLLGAEGIAGQSYNCCDLYVSEYEVAMLARQFSGSKSQIRGQKPTPKHTIATLKLEALGMRFGRRPMLGGTIRQMVDFVRSSSSA